MPTELADGLDEEGHRAAVWSATCAPDAGLDPASNLVPPRRALWKERDLGDGDHRTIFPRCKWNRDAHRKWLGWLGKRRALGRRGHGSVCGDYRGFEPEQAEADRVPIRRRCGWRVPGYAGRLLVLIGPRCLDSGHGMTIAVMRNLWRDKLAACFASMLRARARVSF